MHAGAAGDDEHLGRRRRLDPHGCRHGFHHGASGEGRLSLVNLLTVCIVSQSDSNQTRLSSDEIHGMEPQVRGACHQLISWWCVVNQTGYIQQESASNDGFLHGA